MKQKRSLLRGALIILLFADVSRSFAQEPPGYYAVAGGKTGAALFDALHEIISGHTVVPYTSLTWRNHPGPRFRAT